MALDLKGKDYERLDAFLKQILEWHAAKEVSTVAAVGALQHVFSAAAKDYSDEVASWLHDPDVIHRWKDDL